MKMQGNTTEIDERNLLRLDALLSHGYGLSPQLVIVKKSTRCEFRLKNRVDKKRFRFTRLVHQLRGDLDR